MKLKVVSLAILATLLLVYYKIYQTHNKTIFTIGSGSKNAMFYPVASALCDIFNQYNDEKNIICEAKLSKGAEFNLDAVESGKFDMGISQANLQSDAYMGRKKFTGKPHKNLRTLFDVHNEYLTIITKKDANIKSFSDLFGKKVNIGNKGSGSRILFLQMIEKLAWSLNDFKELYEESGSDINKVLCVSNKADAAVYIVGHPNKSFKSMIDNCNLKLVSLSESEIEKFISLSPEEFYKSAIPEGTYKNSPDKIDTFASKTILTTSARLDKKIVRKFVKVIYEHKEDLIKRQPSLTPIKFYETNDPNLAPLHEGLTNQ